MMVQEEVTSDQPFAATPYLLGISEAVVTILNVTTVRCASANEAVALRTDRKNGNLLGLPFLVGAHICL